VSKLKSWLLNFVSTPQGVICVHVALHSEYLGEYTSQGKTKIPLRTESLWIPVTQQAVGPALRIMQLNVEGLSAAKRHIIESLAEIHHIDVICLQETHVNDDKSDRLTFAYEKKKSTAITLG